MNRLHSIELHLLMLAGVAFLVIASWQAVVLGHRAQDSLARFDGVSGATVTTLDYVNRPCGAKDNRGNTLPQGFLCSVGTAATNAAAAEAEAKNTLEIVNRQCGVKVDGKFVPCGTLADVGQTLGAYRHTATLVNIAARHEDRQLTTVDGRLGRLFDSGDVAMGKFNKLLDAAKVAVQGLDPVETQVTALIAEVRPAAAELPAIAQHVNGMSSSGDKMLADAQWKEHQLLHPNKKKLTFWGAMDGGVLWFHSHLMPSIF